MRVLRPSETIRAFYAGRDGERFAPGASWVDDDLELGTASYAVVSEGEALVYDTHLTAENGRAIRRALEAEGARRFTVMLSHWHLDHVAGTAAFADCEVIATERCAAQLERQRAEIEAGTLWGGPPIDPLVLPSRTFEDRLDLRVGSVDARAIAVDIHSDDAAVLWLAGERALLAGDVVEDTVTYVDHPEAFDNHLADLARLSGLGPARVLPAHGDPGVIESGGYPASIIDATRDYIGTLIRARTEPELRATPLRELIAPALADGSLTYFEAYEAVHRQNLERALEAS